MKNKMTNKKKNKIERIFHLSFQTAPDKVVENANGKRATIEEIISDSFFVEWSRKKSFMKSLYEKPLSKIANAYHRGEVTFDPDCRKDCYCTLVQLFRIKYE